MPISTCRASLERSLLTFAWDEWAQMGIFAQTAARSPWAQDPEALLVFTLEIARLDPRLFDEVLDWVLTNEPLLSVRRLRAMCIDEEDRRLVDALLAWVSTHRPRARLRADGGRTGPERPLPLFPALAVPIGARDPAFEAHGLLRPIARPSRKSSPPDLRAPINFDFRLRQLLGVGARAEAVRVLLTVDAPRVTAQVVARAAGFSKRNVHEALVALHGAGAITAVSIGVEQRYAADREAWGALLDIAPDAWPTHRDWPQLLGSLKSILRSLRNVENSDISEYLASSHLRDALELARPSLEYAGVHVASRQTADTAHDDLQSAIEGALGLLGGVGRVPDAR